jgi:hypothetical protein
LPRFTDRQGASSHLIALCKIGPSRPAIEVRLTPRPAARKAIGALRSRCEADPSTVQSIFTQPAWPLAPVFLSSTADGQRCRLRSERRLLLMHPYCRGGGPIGRGPPMPTGPCSGGGAAADRYQGLVRHSDSVPEADAWQAAKVLKEHPLQPGLSKPCMQNGYCDMPVWAEAGA